MERSIIVNNGINHQERVKAGIRWLADKGGGTIYIPLFRDFERYFGKPRKTYERYLASMRIHVEKMGAYMSPHGHVLMLYPNVRQIEMLEEHERDGDTMVVEWNTKWLDAWRERFDVKEYEVTFE